MDKQKSIASSPLQDGPSREELEQYLRARAWKDDTFRQELLTNPQAVLQRDCAVWFPNGIIPSDLSIKVIEEEEQSICFVLPPKALDVLPNLEDLDAEELCDVSGGKPSDNCRPPNTSHFTCSICTRICSV